MKRKIIKILILIALVLFIHQGYWYSSMGGNLTIWVNNSAINSIENVKIYLDNEEIADDNFSNGMLDYKSYSAKVFPGKHVLKVISRENNINKEYKFYSIFVQRALISFSNSDENINNFKTNIYVENVVSRMVH